MLSETDLDPTKSRVRKSAGVAIDSEIDRVSTAECETESVGVGIASESDLYPTNIRATASEKVIDSEMAR